MANQSIGFLGLGLMGTGMARRLLKAGFELTVYNRTPERASAIVSEGARVAKTPRAAAQDADVVIAMLADDAASRSLWLGPDGALAGVKTGTLLIECSTLSVGWVEDLAAAAKSAGCDLLDAPVTGSKPQAAAGELLFLVGGAEAALSRARPALAAMSRDIIHLGPTGSGARVKLINNFLCGVQLVSVAQAMRMIEQSNLDREKTLSVLTNGAPGSPMVKTIAGRIASRNYEPNFLLKLMLKDMTYAIQEAREHAGGMELTTAQAAADALAEAVDAGHGEKDMSSVFELYRKP